MLSPPKKTLYIECSHTLPTCHDFLIAHSINCAVIPAVIIQAIQDKHSNFLVSKFFHIITSGKGTL